MSSWDMFFDGQDSGLFSCASFGVDFTDFVVDIIAAVAGFPVFWTGFLNAISLDAFRDVSFFLDGSLRKTGIRRLFDT
jgi:hypothetical protein